jgi:hypothetical protein
MSAKTWPVVLALIGLLLVAAACNDGNGDGEESPTEAATEGAPLSTAVSDETPVATAEGESALVTATPGEQAGLSADDQAALIAATEAGLAAIENGDAAGLRAIMSEDLNEIFPDDEMSELFDCYGSAVFAAPPVGDVAGEGNSATVGVVFIGPEDVELTREWQYQRQGEAWLLRIPPQCPPTL